MFAQLGEVVFEALNTPTTFGVEESIQYARQGLIEGKPRTQFIGINLKEIEIEIRFSSFFTSPDVSIRKLREAMESRKPMAFIKGTGEYLGQFLIDSLEHKLIDAGADGSGLIIDATVRLVEFVEPDPVLAAKKDAEAKGLAIKNNKPNNFIGPPSVVSPSLRFMSEINSSKSQVNSAAGSIKKAQQEASKAEKMRQNAQSALSKAREGMANARRVAQQAQSIQSQAQSIVAEVNQAQRNIEAAITLVTDPDADINDVASAINRASAAVENTNTAATPVMNFGVSRKG